MGKKWIFCALAAVLCLTLYLPVRAAEEEEPDPWAAPAMTFAVEHGLLPADDMRPREAATRTVLSLMVAELLDSQARADRSRFSDAQPGSWYYDALSRGVAMGLFQGNGSSLGLNSVFTREQVITVMARCFGVPDGDRAVLTEFSDADQISDWAAGAAAGMVAEGYIQGDGSLLSPQRTMSRQEVAQLIYRLAGTVAAGELEEQTGNVTLLPTGDTVTGGTVDGDLLLGCSLEPITLEDVQISGRLVIHGGTVRLTGSTAAGEVVCCGENITLESNGLSPVRVTGGNALLSGGGQVTAQGDAVLLSGLYSQVTVENAQVTVGSEAQVDRAALHHPDSRLTGEGSVAEATIRYESCTVTAPTGQIVETLDPGISQVVIQAVVPINDATPSAPAISTTVRFDHVDVANCATAAFGVRYCTLSWYVDGELVHQEKNFPLRDGAQCSIQLQADYTGRLKASRTVTVRLTYEDQQAELTQTADQHIEQVSSPVRTINIEATTRRATTLYSSSKLTGKLGTVAAGVTGIYSAYAGTTAGWFTLPDGRTAWAPLADLQISTKNYVRSTDYTQVEKENYVNIKGYDSTTRYLVWVSRLTQTVNVFTGGCRDWTLLHVFPCSTGKNSTPTIPGVFRYQYRMYKWDFDYYYVLHPMIFNGEHAFHTRTYRTTGGLLDPTIGKPVSNGCVRLYDEAVDWLWNNLPYNTTVVVY